jgi:hypothetical protein
MFFFLLLADGQSLVQRANDILKFGVIGIEEVIVLRSEMMALDDTSLFQDLDVVGDRRTGQGGYLCDFTHPHSFATLFFVAAIFSISIKMWILVSSPNAIKTVWQEAND